MSFTENMADFPTVLLAELEEPFRSTLSLGLRDQGYAVLEAYDWAETFNFIKSHSRPIHLLLTNAEKADSDLAEMLKPYRPELQILFIARHKSESLPNVLYPEIILAKVKELLKPWTVTAADKGF